MYMERERERKRERERERERDLHVFITLKDSIKSGTFNIEFTMILHMLKFDAFYFPFNL
mgnify:CR=1 FL=1